MAELKWRHVKIISKRLSHENLEKVAMSNSKYGKHSFVMERSNDEKNFIG